METELKVTLVLAYLLVVIAMYVILYITNDSLEFTHSKRGKYLLASIFWPFMLFIGLFYFVHFIIDELTTPKNIMK